MGIAFNKWKVGNFDHGILDFLVHLGMLSVPEYCPSVHESNVPIIVRPAACRLLERCSPCALVRAFGRLVVRSFQVSQSRACDVSHNWIVRCIWHSRTPEGVLFPVHTARV